MSIHTSAIKHQEIGRRIHKEVNGEGNYDAHIIGLDGELKARKVARKIKNKMVSDHHEGNRRKHEQEG